MAGLVGYDSSDEDEDIHEEPQPQSAERPEGANKQENKDQSANGPNGAHHAPTSAVATEPAAIGPVMGPALPPDASLVGPRLPAAGEAGEEEVGEPAPAFSPRPLENGEDGRPTSPYSANRALLRDLTLPPVPNLDIPPSPPGTPPPSLAALNARFETFLDLKRRKGTHFNARLAQSSAMKNPALMDKLLAFVGVDTGFEDDGSSGGNAAAAASKGKGKKTDPVAQYATTLPVELWDPAAFPAWAYRGPLRRSQEAMRKERARVPGEAVEFVSASETASKAGSRAGTPMGGAGTGRPKTRFDT